MLDEHGLVLGIDTDSSSTTYSGSPAATMKVAENTTMSASHTVTTAIYIATMVWTHWFIAVTSRTTSIIA